MVLTLKITTQAVQPVQIHGRTCLDGHAQQYMQLMDKSTTQKHIDEPGKQSGVQNEKLLMGRVRD